MPPGGSGSARSLADVFDRFPELAEQASKLTRDDVPADVLADVEVEASSPGGQITVHMRGSQVTHIGVDEAWWDDQPARAVVGELVAAVNAAIERANDAAVAQLTALNTSFGEVVRNVAELQADAHRAYVNDLARVTEPLRGPR